MRLSAVSMTADEAQAYREKLSDKAYMDKAILEVADKFAKSLPFAGYKKMLILKQKQHQ